MSLSARIAVGPSRRLAIVASALPVGGIVVAATTAIARWPAAWPVAVWMATVVVIATVAWSVRRHRQALRCSLTVSDRSEIDIDPSPDATTDTWRLAESTMAWPGFVVLALAAGRTTLRLPIVEAEMAARDRHALARFARWSLRGGAPSAAPVVR